MPASQEPIEYLWGVLGMRKYWVLLFCKMLGRWGQPEFPGHEAMAELEIANTTFGIQSVHLTTGPWKQVLKPYGKQLELPSRLKAFANVKRKKQLMRLPAQGISLCGSPSVLCQKCIQWWSSAIYNMCHFVFGREEVTKRSYFYLFYFIYLRPAFIKHGTEITLDFPSVFFYCFFM